MEHNGQTYEEKQEGEATVEWLTDRFARHGQVDYRYRLDGAHAGPAIEVWMINAGVEPDEDGEMLRQ